MPESLEKTLKIHVTTNSKQTGIRKGEGRLEIKLKSKPLKGEANKELKELLSNFFGVPINNIKIIKGLKSKNKIINVKYYS